MRSSYILSFENENFIVFCLPFRVRSFEKGMMVYFHKIVAVKIGFHLTLWPSVGVLVVIIKGLSIILLHCYSLNKVELEGGAIYMIWLVWVELPRAQDTFYHI